MALTLSMPKCAEVALFFWVRPISAYVHELATVQRTKGTETLSAACPPHERMHAVSCSQDSPQYH